jgi:hypothetical protein
MNYTIREINGTSAIVDFEDGAWAQVPMAPDMSIDDFDELVKTYETPTGVNPDWAASIVGTARVSKDPVLDATPVQPDWLINRIAAYGNTFGQIEFMVENGFDAWVAEVSAIKLANPKT